MFQQYRKKQLALMRPYIVGEDMSEITVNDVDHLNGSPKEGDMVAMNPQNSNDQWLVAAKFFAENYDPA